MICLKPLEITDSLLNFSTEGIPEWDSATWAAGLYETGDVVQSFGVIYTFVAGAIGFAAMWISGVDYPAGSRAKSPISGDSYISNSSGISTIDPSLDVGRWVPYSLSPPKYFPTAWTPSPYCNAPEPKTPATPWVSGTTYSIDTVVSVSAKYMEYKRILGGTIETCIIGAPYIEEDIRYSPSNGEPYKCILAVSSATDPATDTTHWKNLKLISPEDNTQQWLPTDPVERVWVRGATYEFWDQVILTSTHRKYRRKSAGTGTQPPNLDTTNWLDDGPTNRYACFDTLRNTKTVLKSPLTLVIRPQTRISSVYLMGLKATSVNIKIVVDNVEVYAPPTFSLLSRSTSSWYTYFFGSFKTMPAYGINIPPYSSAVIIITIYNTTGDVELGACCLGNPIYVGPAQISASSTALNFSQIERDSFGNTTLIPSRSVPKTDQSTLVDPGLVDALYDLRTDVNAIPCVWSSLDDDSSSPWFKAFLILGVYREFSITAKDGFAEVQFQIEEV